MNSAVRHSFRFAAVLVRVFLACLGFEAQGLPVGWSSLDIGGPGVAGSGVQSGGTWTVRGGGEDVWGKRIIVLKAFKSAPQKSMDEIRLNGACPKIRHFLKMRDFPGPRFFGFSQNRPLFFPPEVFPAVNSPNLPFSVHGVPGGIRVPFIASWKNHITAGQVVDAPVASIDATATALKVAGALAPKPSTKAEATLDGINLMPLLTGKVTQLPERPLFWCVGKKNALRLGDWKLIRDGKEWQLYDLTQDISETRNLAPQEPARVQKMSALWDKWNDEQIEPLWR